MGNAIKKQLSGYIWSYDPDIVRITEDEHIVSNEYFKPSKFTGYGYKKCKDGTVLRGRFVNDIYVGDRGEIHIED